jgi:hypothetical protein
VQLMGRLCPNQSHTSGQSQRVEIRHCCLWCSVPGGTQCITEAFVSEHRQYHQHQPRGCTWILATPGGNQLHVRQEPTEGDKRLHPRALHHRHSLGAVRLLVHAQIDHLPGGLWSNCLGEIRTVPAEAHVARSRDWIQVPGHGGCCL